MGEKKRKNDPTNESLVPFAYVASEEANTIAHSDTACSLSFAVVSTTRDVQMTISLGKRQGQVRNEAVLDTGSSSFFPRFPSICLALPCLIHAFCEFTSACVCVCVCVGSRVFCCPCGGDRVSSRGFVSLSVFKPSFSVLFAPTQ